MKKIFFKFLSNALFYIGHISCKLYIWANYNLNLDITLFWNIYQSAMIKSSNISDKYKLNIWEVNDNTEKDLTDN
jgi:hypothetical protein